MSKADIQRISNAIVAMELRGAGMPDRQIALAQQVGADIAYETHGPVVRAVLQAIREPTREQCQDVLMHTGEGTFDDYVLASARWTAMIDKLLDESE